MRKILYPGICLAALLASSIAVTGARQAGGSGVQIDSDDIELSVPQRQPRPFQEPRHWTGDPGTREDH